MQKIGANSQCRSPDGSFSYRFVDGGTPVPQGFLAKPKNTKTSGTLFTRNIRVARLKAANAVQNGNPTVFWTAIG